MLSSRIHSKLKNLRLLKNLVKRSSAKNVVQTSTSDLSGHESFQFSKARLVEFGELPVGEVPLELKHQPKTQTTTLENKASIVTELYPSQLAQVSVFVNAGSRWETLEASGSARMLTNLFLRGTEKKNRAQLEEAINSLGAELEVTCERELIGISLNVHKNDANAALNLLLEMVTSTKVNEA